MSDFWEFVWLIIVAFAFVAYLIVLFQIVGDMFRDKDLKGWQTAVWIIFLVFLPLITAAIYLIARGSGMARRQAAAAQQARSDADAYIRDVAGRSPAQEIADAKAMLDAGTINAAEYEKIKAKALA